MYIMCEWCVVLCCGVVLCCVVLCCVVLCCVVLCCVVLCCVVLCCVVLCCVVLPVTSFRDTNNVLNTGATASLVRRAKWGTISFTKE